MWIEVNGRWHYVIKTDPDFISWRGEMLHETRCGLLKISLSYVIKPEQHIICGRCRNLLEKDAVA